MTDHGARWRDAASDWIDRYAETGSVREASGREPLTAGQHILHLLLTVFTGGLWAPVWIIRAARGNPVPD